MEVTETPARRKSTVVGNESDGVRDVDMSEFEEEVFRHEGVGLAEVTRDLRKMLDSWKQLLDTDRGEAKIFCA